MKIGVVVGRFQINELHNGHLQLLDALQKNSDHVIIFLGCAVNQSKKYPLSYQMREQMIRSVVQGEVTVLPVTDNDSDEVWSKDLDQQIEAMSTPTDTVVMYGGRSSFIDAYTTKRYATEALNFGDSGISSTEIRKRIGNKVINSSDWRAGIIHGVQTHRPIIHHTVDIAMIRVGVAEDNSDPVVEVLLGRKPGETKWRFPGGFVDYADPSTEVSARRELHEETGMVVEGELTYICNCDVDDWRYRGIDDQKIMTTLYACNYSFGMPEAGDDLCEVEWWPIGIDSKELVGNHEILIENLQEYISVHGWS